MLGVSGGADDPDCPFAHGAHELMMWYKAWREVSSSGSVTCCDEDAWFCTRCDTAVAGDARQLCFHVTSPEHERLVAALAHTLLPPGAEAALVDASSGESANEIGGADEDDVVMSTSQASFGLGYNPPSSVTVPTISTSTASAASSSVAVSTTPPFDVTSKGGTTYQLHRFATPGVELTHRYVCLPT